ncbi:MAG: nitrilase-related carbon-nitrogen hydrolase [Desulfobulbales bacterium]
MPFFAGFVQFDVQYGETEKNLHRVKAGLAEIAAGNRQISPGIIVLPELWATGFAYTKLPDLAETMPDLLEKMQGLAAKYQVLIAGSLPEYSHNSYYNTLYITGQEGTIGTYRKQQLFSPMTEDAFFTSGSGSGPVPTSFGPVAGLVCYDLRFPELLRDQARLGAGLLVIPAHWPAARVSHWRILVQARAIENQMYVVAANSCGTSGDTLFGGHSMIVGPDGSILLEAGDGKEWGGTMLDPAMILTARSLFSTIPAKKGK